MSTVPVVKEWDHHTVKASELFKIPCEEITVEQRQLAKRLGFAYMYGVQPSHGNFLMKEAVKFSQLKKR